MNELDGHHLYGAFREGAKSLRDAQDELNRINVFPVPDGDTGTNMAVTLTHAVETIEASDSASATMASMADAALAGARGNSGVIFAQFLSGLKDAVAGATTVSLSRFVHGIEHAYESARKAITEPVEGTILSVIHDWALALRHELSGAENFRELFHATLPALRRSLEATRNQLEVLRRAGVVDAGASGFVAFVHGARNYLERGSSADSGPGAPRDPKAVDSTMPGHFSGAAPSAMAQPGGAGPVPTPLAEGTELEHGSPEGPRYCAEFLVSGGRIDTDALRAELAGLGDSLIVAGSGRIGRVHIHTDQPTAVHDVVAGMGTLVEQKVDDMRRQREDAEAAQRGDRIALVTDSTCDLPAELMDRYHIHVIPLFLRFGEDEYLDRLTLDPATFYDRAEASTVYPVSSQPAATGIERLYRTLLSHYGHVVALHVAAPLSGTFEASLRAAQAVDPERIRVFDSRQLSGSLGLVVLRAATFLEEGQSFTELCERLPEWFGKAEILVSVRRLDSMVRGGRVSAFGGALGSALNVKPIVSLDVDGRSKLYGAAFGVSGNLRKIVRMVEARNRRAPLRNYAVVHAHDPQGACRLAGLIEERIGMPALFQTEISAVVGMNAGRGALAVVMMSE